MQAFFFPSAFDTIGATNNAKSEIQVVAEELGLVAHMGDKFQKLMSGKKEDLIKALLEVDGFDYHGKVPGHLQYSR